MCVEYSLQFISQVGYQMVMNEIKKWFQARKFPKLPKFF